MKLRLGQPVHTTDARFGQVADIVIDPAKRSVTHLVVEPDHDHMQARLVPIGRVTVDGDDVRLNLTTEHLRELELVAKTDFVHPGARLHVGPDWDIGTEDVVCRPDWTDEGPGVFHYEDRKKIVYHRIPRGECEIRRKSAVVGANGRVLGHVEGFLVEDGDLAAVVVVPSPPSLRGHVLLPMSTVTTVRSDEIKVSLDRARFRRLPSATGLEGPLGDAGFGRVTRGARSAAAGLVARLHRIRTRGTQAR